MKGLRLSPGPFLFSGRAQRVQGGARPEESPPAPWSMTSTPDVSGVVAALGRYAPDALRSPELPIGVFDSGLGGLTVMRELTRRLPAESLIYFGDTARLPYGSKSPRAI